MTTNRFEASSDTRFLAQALAKAKPGETIGYDALSEAIGRDVRAYARSSLGSALRMALRDGLVFEADPNIGYRRLSDQEIVRTQGAKTLSRIGNAAKTGARRISKANFESLSNEERISHNAQLSILGAVGQMAKPKTLARVTAAVSNAGGIELPIGSTLKLFTERKEI